MTMKILSGNIQILLGCSIVWRSAENSNLLIQADLLIEQHFGNSIAQKRCRRHVKSGPVSFLCAATNQWLMIPQKTRRAIALKEVL